MPAGAFNPNQANAAYYNGKTYFGYASADGTVHVSSYDHTTHAVVTSPAIVSGLTEDLHNTPSVLVRSSDHKILVAIAPHTTAHMYVVVSSNAEDVSAWGTATDIAATLGDTSMTYANLFQLSGESGKIYLFYRQGSATTVSSLKFSTSTDGGATWVASTELFAPGQAGGYWVMDSDTSRIDFALSDGDPAASTTGSLYHFYYAGGSYFQSNGTAISASLPLAGSDLTKISDGATDGSVRAPTGIVNDGADLYVCWAAADTAGWATNPERYWYAIYTGGAWNTHDVTDAGAIPDVNSVLEGCTTLDHIDPSRMYVAKSSDGNYQIYLYETSDAGSTWTTTQVTTDSGDMQNIHPVSPRSAAIALRCLWSCGTLQPSSSFAAAIRGYPNPVTAF